MIGLVTPEARAMVAESEQRRESMKRHDMRHPDSGRFVPARPATSWPGTDAHGAAVDDVRLKRVTNPLAPAPEPQTTLTDRFSADKPERHVHPGSVSVQHLNLATVSPARPQAVPAQPPFRSARSGTGSVR